MMRRLFEIESGRLRITEESGEGVSLDPDGLEVRLVLQLDPSDAVVLLKAPPGSGRVHNLVKVSADGDVAWRAELPAGNQTDSFVSVETDAHGLLVANTWSGYRVRIDQTTGLIQRSQFTK